VDIPSGKTKPVEALDAYTDMGQIAMSRDNRVALIASTSRLPARVISLELDATRIPPRLGPSLDEPPAMQVIVEASQPEQIHRRSGTEHIPPEQLSDAQAISWNGHDGEPVYGLYYAPSSDRFEGSGQPALIVIVHGGPTSAVNAAFNGTAQFFATRGYAVLLPNYRGSTGYGKAYMNRLRGSWGVYDVEDSATGASHLAAQGLADPTRLVIMGGSAGGFTVLQSLVDKPGFYRAGVCLYGVSNQFGLATDTHKLEERYLDSLLGPLPEAAALYRERSPVFHADRIIDPIIIFQGEDDKVVPRNQSDTIVESLRARGVPHEYHVYAGEGHGWRKPETIDHYHQTMQRFLAQYVLYA
jgi:dipeptidyl aminopeptidase/acylaminoacyl peptidase